MTTSGSSSTSRTDEPPPLRSGSGIAGASATGWQAGSVTENSAPPPGRSATVMVPLWDDTMPWQTDNPRPVPEPIGLVVKNGSNILGRKASGTPGPLSATSIRTMLSPWTPSVWTDVVSHNLPVAVSGAPCEVPSE